MLFEEEKPVVHTPVRPKLPAGTPTDYEIGFLFNFQSGKSTRFDLEPVLIYNRATVEYKRVSMQSDKGLAWLQPLDESFYNDLLEFSDNKILAWMTRTGNRFIRNHSGSWAHVSARELVNLRRHYRDLLDKLWPKLSAWPNLFILRYGRFSNVRQQTVSLGKEFPQLSFTVEQKAKTIVLSMKLTLDGEPADINILGGFLLESNGKLFLPRNTEDLALIDLFKNGPLSFPLSVKKEIISKYVTPWLDKYEVTISERLNIRVITPEVQSHVMLSELNESNLMIRPEFAYNDVTVDYGDEKFHVREQDGRIEIIRRNKEQEKEVYEYLRTLHPAFNTQRNNLYYYLPFDDVMKRGWFIGMMRKLQSNGYAIRGLSQLRKFRYTTDEPVISIKAATLPEWFELKVSIRWGKQEVSLKEIRQAILNHEDTIMLEDGTLGHIPEEWISQYSLLFRSAREQDGVLTVAKFHYTLLEDILDKIDDKTVKLDIEERKRKMLEFDKIAAAPLSKEVKASLRPYQLSGFHWLQTLDELGWGGCLADDMGLGKTLQTISFLQYVKEKYPGSTQLVICPTSLIFNWENEIKKFCPSMKFHTHYGMQREFTDSHFENTDVILTTYGVVRNDIEHLTKYLWQYVILDESQAIKNPDARTTKTIHQLRAVNRIILSGTPVQNNTSDLYSQFSFVNPGLLGNREYFNREFAVPIDKFGSREKTQQLKKVIHPFTLRRTKEQVAKDLPDKTITVLWCTMETEQRKLYDEYRNSYRKKLLKKIDEDGIEKSGMQVLEGLLRLRQICDHPGMVNLTEENRKSSVKIEEIVREVQENSGFNKVLIFSQFTEMLGFIREEFDESGIPYCYLDGSTSMKARQEQVTKFQEDESIKAFLISLKAGGVGLNLTVADYVYIVDPWWNPAAEQQAIDRAHRIGQKRKVFAYKMICKDSVEEKILQLQERKKMLADDLIQEDAGFMKALSREDVEFLFG